MYIYTLYGRKKRSGLAKYRRAYGCCNFPTYIITYNGNANTSGNVPIDGSSPYRSGSTVTVLGNSGSPALEKAGFTFAGWNTIANGTGLSFSQGNTFTINANTTLYAQWTPVTYIVTYNGNTNTSGNVPNDGSSPYTSGSNVTVLGNSGSPVLAKAGFTFAGWNTIANGTGLSFSQGNTFTINANRTLYAQWTPVTYIVTYNGNTNTSGNVPTDESSPYASVSNVTVLGNSGSPILEKSGFTFAGWNTIANGSGISFSQGEIFTIYANMTLYAQWRPVDSSPPSTPTSLSSVGGNQSAYILFTQVGGVTNYEYSTDNGTTFVAFNPPQTFSPVEINTLSNNVATRLTNATTYTVKLKAVNSADSSSESVSVNVTPTTTSLATSGRLIHLDANNSTSYSGSGADWTNLDSGGLYSARLQSSPTFDNINKWFTFNGINQVAQIAAATAINPTLTKSFTIQIWARVNRTSPNFGAWDGLISKQAPANGYDGYSLNLASSSSVALKMNGGIVDGTDFSPTGVGVYSNRWALYTIVVRYGGGSVNPSYAYVSTRLVVTVNNDETNAPSSTSLTPLQFPRGVQEGIYNFCPADVGAFYLYDTALSQEDIIRNYDATKPRYI